MHLLYARFIGHFLHDEGITSGGREEPFARLVTQGMVRGKTFVCAKSGAFLTEGEREGMADEDMDVVWAKMSKSKHNGVDPVDVVGTYGADVVRLFMLFKAPPAVQLDWDTNAIQVHMPRDAGIAATL